MPQIMVAKLRLDEHSNTIICRTMEQLRDALPNILPDEESPFSDMRAGAVITITFEEMDEEAFVALDEFEGW